MSDRRATLTSMRWLAAGEAAVPDTTAWMTPGEVGHLRSIRFTKRRTEFLTRRWATKRAVAAALDLEPDEAALRRIEVLHRPSGAPFLHVDGEPAELAVSMSDRSGWAVCLVGAAGELASRRIGIDLEVVEPRSAAFLDDYFTRSERAFVADQPSERRDELANLIWSAKEAALKVQQVGLRADTRTVDVDLRSDQVVDGWSAMTVMGSGGPMPGWWRRLGVFVLTLASAEETAPPKLLPASADLHAATPRHSWLDSPVC